MVGERVRLALRLPPEGVFVAVILGLAEAFDDHSPGLVPGPGL